jgi:hypothetical protein
MINSRFAAIALAALLAMFARCSQLTGGAGGETTNGHVTGIVKYNDGSYASSARVQLFPADYDPVKDTAVVPADTTDSLGRYTFSYVASGDYNIHAVHSDNSLKTLVTGIHVDRDTIVVPADTLRIPGTIKLLLPPDINSALGYIYIPGTSYTVFLNNRTDFIIVDAVPANVIPALSYSTIQSTSTTTIRYAVRVNSNDTTVVRNPLWNRARKFVLNTSTTGSNVTGDIVNFPLHVRLNPGNFDFSQAQAGGTDIRFTKSDNTFLPYEIERWDSVNRRAEIWVKADTVYGSDSTQSIMMYWGNPAAADASDGAAVFDSSSGFEGVWHLSEISGTLALDASHNGFSGTYRGGLPNTINSPLGICQNIVRPDSDYIDMGNVLNPGMKNFAIGVWLKRRALGTQQALIAKTNGGYPSAAYGYLFNFDASNLVHLYIATGSGTSWFSDSVFEFSSNLTITDSVTWHYIFAVVDRSDNARCKMYIDGIDRTGVVGGDVTRISAVSNALNLRIGTETDDNCSFSGSIGEVTIAFTARSADWVKLCYMNQKEQDALVRWR